MSQQSDLKEAAPLPNVTEYSGDSFPQVALGLRGLPSKNTKRQYTIAILTRSRVPGIAQVVQALTQHVMTQAPGQFTFVWFVGENDERSLMKQATHVIQHYTIPYDALVTVGILATVVASRVSRLLNIRIPIIFTSVAHPTQLGILYTGSTGRQNITGVAVDDTAYGLPASILQTLKKSVRNVLLPYDPTGQAAQLRLMALSQFFLSHDIRIQIVPITHRDEVVPQIIPFIHTVDSILTPRHESILSEIPAIARLCNSFGVTLFSTDLASVQQGAAIGFSPKESVQGIEAANFLLIMFKENVRPEDLAVKSIQSKYYLGINEAALEKQGVSLSEEALKEIEDKIIY